MTERTLLVLRIMHWLHLACSDSNGSSLTGGWERRSEFAKWRSLYHLCHAVYLPLCGVPLMEKNNLRQCYQGACSLISSCNRRFLIDLGLLLEEFIITLCSSCKSSFTLRGEPQAQQWFCGTFAAEIPTGWSVIGESLMKLDENVDSHSYTTAHWCRALSWQWFSFYHIFQ